MTLVRYDILTGDKNKIDSVCLTPSDQVWFSVVPALIVVLNHVQACWLLTQYERMKKDPLKCIKYIQDLPSWAQLQRLFSKCRQCILKCTVQENKNYVLFSSTEKNDQCHL